MRGIVLRSILPVREQGDNEADSVPCKLQLRNMTGRHPHKIPDNKDIKVLIVDDDQIVLEVMKGFIVSYGFAFATASNGNEAVIRLEKEDFDIVLTDISMPHMDGMELLEHVNAKYPETGVIVITGLSEEYSYIDVISAGAIDYMTKPFNGNELLAKLQRVIREQAIMKELEELSICDSLTGIYNRRHFDTKLTEELHRANRQEYRVFLALIDIDRFKGYNDTYGHQSGDNLLSTLGNILKTCARHGVDWPFRYGGDEFAIIIPQTDLEQAIKIIERIKTSYDSYRFSATSLSCGLAEFIRDKKKAWAQNTGDFVSKVDENLYQAKDKGRNRIIVS